jgi:hypothetical protein
MKRWRQIFPIGAAAVLVTLTVTGCPSTAQPVDTSQRILVESAEMLRAIDGAVVGGINAASESARTLVAGRMDTDCEPGEDRGDCAVRLFREEMQPYYQLVAALEAVRGTLQTWEDANDAWRASGDRPGDWAEVVCEPVRTATETILELLPEVGLEIEPRWRDLVQHADEVCSLGVAIAEVVAPEQRTVEGEEVSP